MHILRKKKIAFQYVIIFPNTSIVMNSSTTDPNNIIRILHECEGGIEKSVPRITDWHHEACQVMKTVITRDGFFYPTLTRIMDSFFLAHHIKIPHLYCKNASRKS